MILKVITTLLNFTLDIMVFSCYNELGDNI
jgi:hypothetical protein